jgi:neutral ceramidase
MNIASHDDVPSTAPIFKAGAASLCITPNEALWLAGYASRTSPARGKLSDLYASAVVIEDHAGQRLVIVSVDLIAIAPIIGDAVVRAVTANYGLSRQEVFLFPTHTHHAPEFRPDKAVFFNIPSEFAARLPEFAKQLTSQIVEVIDHAVQCIEPVRLFARRATVGFAHNRRRHGVKDGHASEVDIYDHDVPILDCIAAAGSRKAILFGYACHNTSIPADDLRYSGDWAGHAKAILQQSNPSATALYIPGAGADQDPEPHGSVDDSRRHGESLASAVQNALSVHGTEITGSIHCAVEDVSLDLQPVARERLEQMLASDDTPQRVKARFLLGQLSRGESLITSYSVPVHAFRLGNELILCALSGEPVVDWSHKLKQNVREQLQTTYKPLTWIAGYCNDMFGYLPTRRIQSEGGYEGGRANLWSWIPAPFTADVEDRITAAVLRLLKRIQA